MGIGSGVQGAVPPWIFIHGTNTVDRGLKVLFSVFFAIFRSFFRLPPGRGFIVLFSVFFSLPPPPEIFLPTLLVRVRAGVFDQTCFRSSVVDPELGLR